MFGRAFDSLVYAGTSLCWSNVMLCKYTKEWAMEITRCALDNDKSCQNGKALHKSIYGDVVVTCVRIICRRKNIYASV